MAGVVVGVLLTALLIVLWYSWATYTPNVPADRAARTDSAAEAPHAALPPHVTYTRDDSLTVPQEPLDDGPLVIPPSEPVPEAPLVTAGDDQSLSAAPDTAEDQPQALPGGPTAAPVVTNAPAAPAPAQKRPETKKALTALAAPAAKVLPAPTEAVTITGRKPASPAKSRGASAPAAVGTLLVAVQPWAEIWIDGRKRGISPPLFRLQLPPGIYTVELRNPDLPSYGQKVQISSGQSVTLRHSFQ